MINLLIVCNDYNNLAQISDSVRRGIETSACIITTTRAEEALSMIKKRYIRFDMFILEVQLAHIGGYKIEEAIRKDSRYTDTPILFITREAFNLVGFSHLATYQNYKKHNYISLPIENIDVQGKIGLYLESIIAKQLKHDRLNRTISFENSRGLTKIQIADILFLEIQNKVCSIHTDKGVCTVARKSLSQLLTQLDTDEILRCHRFYAVNISKIKAIEKVYRRNWTAYFHAAALSCPISQTFIEPIAAAYKNAGRQD